MVSGEWDMTSAFRHQQSRPRRFADLEAIEHEFSLPLIHDDPNSKSIGVFVREVAKTGAEDKPFLLYFEGGPGFLSPRPLGLDPGAWLLRALEDFRVLLLDQRGTGRSTPADAWSLGRLTPVEQANYLRFFRADSIVRDAEMIRTAMGIDRWAVLGDSFGGFCVLTYLSAAPDGLVLALINAGLPPFGGGIDEVYRSTYQRVARQAADFFEHYPADLDRVESIRAWLQADEVRLASGDRLTPGRFNQLGAMLGKKDGRERLHYLLEMPLSSTAFLIDVERATHFDRHPLYAVLHESCWADGGVTDWSAERMLKEIGSGGFTGEHVFPWMFEEYGALAPLRQAADILAERDWGRLYDPAQLSRNDVPTVAAIYADDMYVDSSFSLETAAQVKNLRPWLIEDLGHDGLHTDGGRVLGGLLDRVDIPTRHTAESASMEAGRR